MRPPRAAALLLAFLLAGCVGGPRLVLDGLAGLSDASYADGTYSVNLRGTLANEGAEARRITLRAGVGDDCLTEPALPGFVDVGNLAPGSRTNVRESFEHARPRAANATLWARVLLGDPPEPVAETCAFLAVGEQMQAGEGTASHPRPPARAPGT